jgi:succinate dehydrogenase/fumarate reductase flavoprotein subunit
MWEKAGPIRREAGLRSALDDLAALGTRSAEVGAKSPAELQVAVEVGFMLDVAEVIAGAALERKESRGAHWRLDHPEPDNEVWLRNIIVSRGSDGKPALRTERPSMTRITSPGPCRIGTPWSGGYVVPDL